MIQRILIPAQYTPAQSLGEGVPVKFIPFGGEHLRFCLYEKGGEHITQTQERIPKTGWIYHSNQLMASNGCTLGHVVATRLLGQDSRLGVPFLSWYGGSTYGHGDIRVDHGKGHGLPRAPLLQTDVPLIQYACSQSVYECSRNRFGYPG